MVSRLVVLIVALAAAMSFAHAEDGSDMPAGTWKGKRALDDLASQVSFGPRALDTAGHERTVEYIETELAKTKAVTIKGQQWSDIGGSATEHAALGWVRTGNGGLQHTLVNIVARFYPDNPRRIVIGTHYDGLKPASGMALLLETARALSAMPPPPAGIDFVFFDGEEGLRSLGAGDPQWRPIGSLYFAQHLEDFYPHGKPEQAIILDRLCQRNLELSPEPLSLTLARPETEKFWRIGADVAPAVFREDVLPDTVNGDHDALIKANIPAFLVTGSKPDAPDKCTAASLQAVGHTLLQYIYAL